MRLYHVIAVSETSGSRTYLTEYPMPHEQAMNNLGRFTPHKMRRVQLEEHTPLADGLVYSPTRL